jgi:pimeloyl-ACP methyl ester carboxylesterase
VLKRKIFRYVFRFLIGALVLTGVGGLTYESIGESRDRHRFQSRGCSYDVGGRHLQLNCSGQGSPTVILEAGMLGIGEMWAPVQAEVAKFTRVCSYDRAGYGWSEPGPLPRTSRRIAEELHSLLVEAGEAPPFLLAGASAGGFHVRVYSGLYGDQVAGMVLVDSSHPEQTARFRFPANPLSEEEKWEPFLPLAHRLGWIRFFLTLQDRSKGFSEFEWAEIGFLVNEVGSLKTLLREAESFAEDGEEVLHSGTLGDKPLIVLTGGRVEDAKMRKIWVEELQADLAHLSTRGKQVVLKDAGHTIQLEDPEAVVHAIQELYLAVKGLTH